MDLWRTVLVLFRRWYITVPAFFATLGLAATAYSVIPVQYESGSVLVLTTPLSGGTESTQPNQPNPLTNPLMNFDQSLALTASIIIQQLNSPETAAALGIVPGDTTTYEVNNGSTNPELLQSGPFIFVDGKASSPEAARDITTRVTTMAAKVLAERQDALNAPASTHIEPQVVVNPTVGQPLAGSPLRAAAAAAALAVLATLATVYGFESLMVNRRRRRRLWGQPESHEQVRAPMTVLSTDPEETLTAGHTRSAKETSPEDFLLFVHADSTSDKR